MQPRGKEGQQHPGLQEEEHHQQDKGPDPSSFLSASEATSGVLGPVLGSPVQESCLSKPSKMAWGFEHLSYEDRLRGLAEERRGPGEGKAQGGSWQCV